MAVAPDPVVSIASLVRVLGHVVESLEPQPLAVVEVGPAMRAFLGEPPYGVRHPRLGTPDPTRAVSADGARSVRYGPHEAGGDPVLHHYHEETWTPDTATGFLMLSVVARPIEAGDAAALAAVAGAFDALLP